MKKENEEGCKKGKEGTGGQVSKNTVSAAGSTACFLPFSTKQRKGMKREKKGGGDWRGRGVEGKEEEGEEER